MHPLKIINVWGDAGIVVTDDDEMARQLRLLRNHGLRNRDEMEIFGYNTRLDSVQAVVGKWIVRQARDIVEARARRGARYGAGFAGIDGLRLHWNSGVWGKRGSVRVTLGGTRNN